MSIVRITDIWLRHGSVAENIHHYLVENKAVCDASLTYTVDLSGDSVIELVVELNDDHPKSDRVSDDIHEMLIQARLDFAHGCLLKSLAWSFSSPAKTAKLREILESRHNRNG